MPTATLPTTTPGTPGDTSGYLNQVLPGFNNAGSTAMSNIQNLLSGLPSISATRQANAYFGAGSGTPGSDFIQNRGYDLYGQKAAENQQTGLQNLQSMLGAYSGTVTPTAGQSLQNAQFNQAQGQQASQFGQSLAEQQAALAQAQSQFTQAQGQQNTQFGQNLAQNQGQFTQAQGQQASQFGQNLSNQQNQFGQNLTLEQQSQDFAQKQAALTTSPDYLQMMANLKNYGSAAKNPLGSPGNPIHNGFGKYEGGKWVPMTF